jgi:hypothetical protein
MNIIFPKVSLGKINVTRPKRSINPFSTKQVTLRVPVLKLPKLGFKLRLPFTKS